MTGSFVSMALSTALAISTSSARASALSWGSFSSGSSLTSALAAWSSGGSNLLSAQAVSLVCSSCLSSFPLSRDAAAAGTGAGGRLFLLSSVRLKNSPDTQ